MLDFVDAGHDLLLAVDSDASDELRELAADLGVDFDHKGSVITDHFNRYDKQHAAIMTSNALESKAVFGSSHKHVSMIGRFLDASASKLGTTFCTHVGSLLQAPVIYTGIAASISPRSTLVSSYTCFSITSSVMAAYTQDVHLLLWCYAKCARSTSMRALALASQLEQDQVLLR